MKRFKPEISSGSMADIAFLLLIFFLVATTIEEDKGLLRKLPRPIPTEKADIHQRNVVFVLLNSNGILMVNDVPINANELNGVIKQLVQNQELKKTWPSSPKKAVISLNIHKGANYNTYIQVQNQMAKAYKEMRNDLSVKRYGQGIDELENKVLVKEIKQELPMNISEVMKND